MRMTERDGCIIPDPYISAAFKSPMVIFLSVIGLLSVSFFTHPTTPAVPLAYSFKVLKKGRISEQPESGCKIRSTVSSGCLFLTFLHPRIHTISMFIISSRWYVCQELLSEFP